jgi:hypothetical protein
MWVDIKESLYNLDHYYKIIKAIDECESYKHYCIYLYFKNPKHEADFTIISFKNKEERDCVFDRLHGKIIESIIR